MSTGIETHPRGAGELSPADTDHLPEIAAGRFFRTTLLGYWLVTGAVVFSLIGTFLSRIEGSSNAYGPGVFTGFKSPLDTTDLLAAAGADGIWRPDNAEAPGAFVSWHLTLDYFFMILVAVALHSLLVAVTRAPGKKAVNRGLTLLTVSLPTIYVVADLAETLVTQSVMNCGWRGDGCTFGIGLWDARIIHGLSDVKWIALAANLLLMAFCFFKRDVPGAFSWRRSRRLRRDRKSTTHIAVGPPMGVIVVCAIFAVFLAYPGGGPLDQMPDVLRAQLDLLQGWQSPRTFFLTLTGFTMLVLTTLVVALPGTRVMSEPKIEVTTFGVLAVASVVAGAALAPHFVAEGHTPAPAAYVLVPLGVVLLAALAGLVQKKPAIPRAVADDAPAVETGPSIADEAGLTSRIRRCFWTVKHPSPRTTPNPEGMPGPWNLKLRSRVLVSVLIGGLVLALALGFLRATLPLFMAVDNNANTGVASQQDGFDTWANWIAVGCALVLPAPVALGVFLVVRGLQDGSVGRLRRTRWGIAVVIVAVDLGLAVLLAVDPPAAAWFGTPAALMVGLSFWLLVVGGFGWMNRWVQWRTWRRRSSPSRPMLGLRTPWMALVVGAWMLAGLLDSRAGYQDARTMAVPATEADSPGLSRTMEDAFSTWAKQWAHGGLAGCTTSRRTVPLVLVAAPGGGGKAAYWTAYGMDSVFSKPSDTSPVEPSPEPVPGKGATTPVSFCPANLFAAAGVSGGAVGLATAMAAPPNDASFDAEPQPADADDRRADAEEGGTTDQTAATRTARMTDQGPLAQALATMLLRDIPQPFTTMHGPWRDRAAVLEDAWSKEAGPSFNGIAGPGEKTILELGVGWWHGETAEPRSGPVLLLSAASAGDGCRALVANVTELAAQKKNCLQAALGRGGKAGTGSVSGAVDVLNKLIPARATSGDQPHEDLNEYCNDDEVVGDPQTVRASTGALLAARFPLVTPSGALRRCVSTGTDEYQTSYVVDGGYLENTGILTLLQAWHQVEGYVSLCNTLVDGPGPTAERIQPVHSVASVTSEDVVTCPTDSAGRSLAVEPWFVMLENHYRTRVESPPSPKRPRELLVPLTTAGKKGVTVGYVPMEHAIAYEISRPFPAGGTTVRACNRFIRLAPDNTAEVQAPLGWVLAPDTRRRMREALTKSRYRSLEIDDEGPYYRSILDRCAPPVLAPQKPLFDGRKLDPRAARAED